mgnify:CR=1 FL=1
MCFVRVVANGGEWRGAVTRSPGAPRTTRRSAYQSCGLGRRREHRADPERPPPRSALGWRKRFRCRLLARRSRRRIPKDRSGHPFRGSLRSPAGSSSRLRGSARHLRRLEQTPGRDIRRRLQTRDPSSRKWDGNPQRAVKDRSGEVGAKREGP